jgi:Holliday junction resolvase RusA-like endonuclease
MTAEPILATDLKFTVWDLPQAMPRPRVAIRGGRAHAYTPGRAQQAMWRIRQSAIEALGDSPRFVGPVSLRVVAYLPVPKATPKHVLGIARPIKRPDVDNLAKTVLDGCSPLWLDDAQIVDLRIAKVFAWDVAPHWSIEVSGA